MANIPLKSIKFPGLSDTYTVPQVDDTLATAGAAADAKKTGDELSDLKSALSQAQEDILENTSAIDGKVNKPTGSGIAGEYLKNNGDGTTSWDDPIEGDVSQTVRDWLDDHPEATTTVQDGSLTEAKFADSLKVLAIKDYVTPQMYGAEADGIHDDTEAIQTALTTANSGSGAVYFPAGTYLVTDKLTAYDTSIIEMNPKATLKAGDAIDTVLEVLSGSYSLQRPAIRNINIDGNHLAENGLTVDKLSMERTVSCSGISVKDCTGTGIVFTNCQGGIFEAISSTGNGGDGIHILGCNGMKVFSIASTYNTGIGIVFGKTEIAKGNPSIFGLNVEGNGSYGIKVGDTGPVALYAGHMEGNGAEPLYFDNNSVCLCDGFRILWGNSNWQNDISYCTIKSDFVTIRAIELQAGDHATRVPNIIGDAKPMIENIWLGIMRFYSTISERLFSNIVVGGDMSRNSGVDVYSADKTYKSTEFVDTAAGRTYSLKCVITNVNGFDISLYNNTGFVVGDLYKITCRIYYQGTNPMSLQLKVRDSNNITLYAPTEAIADNEWVELHGYFYAATDTMKLFVGIDQDKPEVGDVFWLSTYFAQPVIPKKIATKQLGKTFLYNYVEPDIMS